MQSLAAVPEGDAAVRVRSAGEAHDEGLPLVRDAEPVDQVTERDRREVHGEADVLHALADDPGDALPHVVAGVGQQRELDPVAGAVLPDAVAVGVGPAQVVEDPVGRVEVVLVAADVGIVKVAGGRADGGPLRVGQTVLHVGDDPVLVDAVGDRLAESQVPEPVELLRCDVGLTGLLVHTGVHVERQEVRPEPRAPPVDREVALGLQRLQLGELLAEHPVYVRVPGQEGGEFGREVLDDDVNDLVQVREPVAGPVGEPVAGIARQDQPLAGRVARDRERSGADDLGGVGVDAPHRREAPVVHVGPQDVLRVDRRAHRAEEGRRRHRQDDPDGVVVQRRDLHAVRPPLAGVVEVAELERRAGRGRDVVVVDDPVEREVHVAGGERPAVVPGHVAAQVERPGQAVLGALPRLGQQGLHLVVQPRRLGQPLEEVPQDVRRSGVGRDGEVEGQRFGDGGDREGAPVRADRVGELLGVGPQLRNDRVGRRGRGDHDGLAGRLAVLGGRPVGPPGQQTGHQHGERDPVTARSDLRRACSHCGHLLRASPRPAPPAGSLRKGRPAVRGRRPVGRPGVVIYRRIIRPLEGPHRSPPCVSSQAIPRRTSGC